MEIFLYIGIFVLVVFVIGTIIWLIARQFPYDPYEGMSDEQIAAIKRQGNAQGCSFFILVGCGTISYLILQIFPNAQEQVRLFMGAIIVLVMVGSFGYIGISSIRNQASILLRERSKKTFSKGQGAVQMGIFTLVLIGLALYVAWVKLTGR